MGKTINRRTFAKTSTAAAVSLTALQTTRAEGANSRVRLGFIGVANRGGQLIGAFLENKNVDIVALCDVSRSTLERANARLGGKAETYGDFRKMLQRPDIDAVVIATPDHWHALQTIAACRAGKDVYVEKPLSLTVHEGRKMVEVARAQPSGGQVGLHRRSSPLYAEAARLFAADGIGKITVSRCYQLSNMYPNGIGKAPPSDPPADLDWQMWLGPRADRPYQATIAAYKFRWWMPFSSQIANNGVHFLDAIRWMTGDALRESAPGRPLRRGR